MPYQLVFSLILMKKFLYGFLIAATPSLTLAAGINERGILGLFGTAQKIIDQAVILIVALAILFFLVQVVKYIRSGGDPEGKGKARQGIIYSLIGIAVMVSVWGLVRILQDTLISGDTNGAVEAPRLPPIR